MVTYKLMRKMKNGSFAPLRCNREQRYLIGNLYKASDFGSVGFHSAPLPYAPHLTANIANRVWVKLEVTETKVYTRPVTKGGSGIISETMKISRELLPSEVDLLTRKVRNK